MYNVINNSLLVIISLTSKILLEWTATVSQRMLYLLSVIAVMQIPSVMAYSQWNLLFGLSVLCGFNHEVNFLNPQASSSSMLLWMSILATGDENLMMVTRF